MTQKILELYAQKMTQFRNLGQGKGVERKKALMEDILNEAIVKILKIAEKEEVQNVESLLNRIIRTTTIDKMRSYQTDSQMVEFVDDYKDLEKDYDYTDYTSYRDLIEHVKSQLTPEQATLFDQYHVNGDSQEVIAARLGVSQPTVQRMIRRLNTKLHQLKIRDLYRTDFVAPTNKDKKLPKYPDYIPTNAVPCQRTAGPWAGTTAYLYESDILDVVDYQEQIGCSLENNFEYDNDRESIRSGCYFAPIRHKPIIDSTEVISLDTGTGIDYHRYEYSTDYAGNTTNRYGCMRQWYQLGKRYNY